jgi:hypothetical protein
MVKLIIELEYVIIGSSEECVFEQWKSSSEPKTHFLIV